MKNTHLEKLIIVDLIIMILIDIFIIFTQANSWWLFPVYNLTIFIIAYFFGIGILKLVFTIIQKINDRTLKANFSLRNIFQLIIFAFMSTMFIFFPIFIMPYFVNNIRQKPGVKTIWIGLYKLNTLLAYKEWLARAGLLINITCHDG